MTEEQWETLLKVINGEKLEKLPVGFIIDSPWLPGWCGISTLDYYTNDKLWFNSNLKAINTFPEVIFLPGFWSEYGMCTEPSAFGSKSIWTYDNLPHAEKIIHNIEEVNNLKKPDVKKDGLLPFVLNRLYINEKKINKEGHFIKFAISRGPLNIAAHLMGNTEFLMSLKTNQDEAHKLLSIITEFIIDWLTLQQESFKTIDGIFLLDDIIGFLGEKDFTEFVLPYMKKIYHSFDVNIKFLHNDADGLITAKYLEEIGVNLYNFSFKHSINEIRKLTDNSVTLLGNIPPRDILARGKVEEIEKCVKELLASIKDRKRLILSCGGGMPQNVSTESIKAFIGTV